mgnify:CR=1 FL=1
MKEETTYGHQELINQVIDYIHTHLHKALTLEMLAAEMHMSVYPVSYTHLTLPTKLEV